MREFDQTWAQDDSVQYFRYADDMLFLTKRDTHQKIYRAVQSALKVVGVEPHPFSSAGKSRWGRLEDGVEFLGYRVSPASVGVRSSGIHRLKRSLALSFARYKKEAVSADPRLRLLASQRLTWFLNLRITGCVLDNQSRGWVQYYSLLTDIGLLRDLDYFVATLSREAGASDFLSAKSFLETYRKWAKRSIDTTGYIPNFDKYAEPEMRTVLEHVFGISEQRMNSNGSIWVEREFSRRTRLHVHSMERDLTPNY